ncbi:MAG: hypothetical protein AAFR02_08330, partial [Pseudomonadota bacterium]
SVLYSTDFTVPVLKNEISELKRQMADDNVRLESLAHQKMMEKQTAKLNGQRAQGASLVDELLNEAIEEKKRGNLQADIDKLVAGLTEAGFSQEDIEEKVELLIQRAHSQQ